MGYREAIIAIGKWMDMYEGYNEVVRPLVRSREQLMKDLLDT